MALPTSPCAVEKYSIYNNKSTKPSPYIANIGRKAGELFHVNALCCSDICKIQLQGFTLVLGLQ